MENSKFPGRVKSDSPPFALITTIQNQLSENSQSIRTLLFLGIWSRHIYHILPAEYIARSLDVAYKAHIRRQTRTEKCRLTRESGAPRMTQREVFGFSFASNNPDCVLQKLEIWKARRHKQKSSGKPIVFKSQKIRYREVKENRTFQMKILLKPNITENTMTLPPAKAR